MWQMSNHLNCACLDQLMEEDLSESVWGFIDINKHFGDGTK